MLRRLLTLIALCAGLAAVAEPARAAVTLVESVRVLERASTACSSRADQRAALPSGPTFSVKDDKGKPCPKPTIVVIVPTVMLQVDRSRE